MRWPLFFLGVVFAGGLTAILSSRFDPTPFSRRLWLAGCALLLIATGSVAGLLIPASVVSLITQVAFAAGGIVMLLAQVMHGRRHGE